MAAVMIGVDPHKGSRWRAAPMRSRSAGVMVAETASRPWAGRRSDRVDLGAIRPSFSEGWGCVLMLQSGNG